MAFRFRHSQLLAFDPNCLKISLKVVTMLGRTALLCLLHFIASTTALGLYNVSRKGFELIIKENDIALVACKSSKVPQAPRSHKMKKTDTF